MNKRLREALKLGVERFCKICGKSSKETHISRRGYCPECWKRIQEQSIIDQIRKQGIYYERWKEGRKRYAKELLGLPPSLDVSSLLQAIKQIDKKEKEHENTC